MPAAPLAIDRSACRGAGDARALAPAWWRRARQAGLRRWVARLTLLAVAFPSFGPWPWLVAEALAGPHAHGTALVALDVDGHPAHRHAGHRHDGDAQAAGAGEDARSIPGTPAHPADHHCVECDVLQHLARCVPAVVPFAAPAALFVAALAVPAPRAVRVPVRAGARPPPARAPPLPA